MELDVFYIHIFLDLVIFPLRIDFGLGWMDLQKLVGRLAGVFTLNIFPFLFSFISRLAVTVPPLSIPPFLIYICTFFGIVFFFFLFFSIRALRCDDTSAKNTQKFSIRNVRVRIANLHMETQAWKRGERGYKVRKEGYPFCVFVGLGLGAWGSGEGWGGMGLDM